MNKLFLAIAFATIAMAGSVATASAAQRNVTVETKRGTITKSADVYCFNGACYREAEITGVNGKTLRRSGMCVLVGFREWDCKGTVTGPAGNTRSRHVTVTAN